MINKITLRQASENMNNNIKQQEHHNRVCIETGKDNNICVNKTHNKQNIKHKI